MSSCFPDEVYPSGHCNYTRRVPKNLAKKKTHCARMKKGYFATVTKEKQLIVLLFSDFFFQQETSHKHMSVLSYLILQILTALTHLE